MARWLVLLITLAAWLATMALVYRTYGPKPIDPAAMNNRASLEAIFADNAPRHTRWRVYVNLGAVIEPAIEKNPELRKMIPEDWQDRFKLDMAQAERAGADPGEIMVGIMTRDIKIRGEVRAEEKSFFNMAVTKDSVPDAFRPYCEISSETTAQITRDLGLEEFTIKLHMGPMPEMVLRGAREGNALRIVQLMYNANDGQKISEQSTRLAISGAANPSISHSPFFYRPEIREGDKWSVVMLDPTSTTALELISVESRVVGKGLMRYYGREVMTYEVAAKIGESDCRAWYSADGHVLKQQVKLLGVLPVTLLLEDAPAVRAPGDPPDPHEPLGH